MTVFSQHKSSKLALVMLLFTLGALAYQSSLPVLEGNDEVRHYNYAVWLAETWRLPDRATHEANIMGQETGQPPLTYWVDAVLWRALNLPIEEANNAILDPVRNPWFTPPDWSHRNDNFNQLLHGPEEKALAHPLIARADRVGRLVSILYGLLAIFGAYGIAQEFFRREVWMWTAVVLFAFTPQMIYNSAILSNDAPATAFATVALWQVFVLLRRSASPYRLIIIGFFVSLATLSKVSAFLITPGIVLAIAFDAYNQRLSWLRAFGNLLVFGAIISLLVGPWVAFGQATDHDPFGLGTHYNAARALISPPSALQLISELPDTALSYWAKFAGGGVLMVPVINALVIALILLSLWGYLGYLPHFRFDLRSIVSQRVVIGAISAVLALAALLYWLIILFPVAFAITGRLIYFVHSIFVVALVGGLSLLAHRIRPRLGLSLRTYAIAFPIATSLVLAPVTIGSIFAAPALLRRDQLPSLHGGPVDFDATVRFLGMSSSSSPLIQAHSLHKMTLCWEVLKPTQRSGAFAVKLFGPQAEDAGGRTSVFGLGQFPSTVWHAGDIFCDAVDVPVSATLIPAQQYNVALIVFDKNNIGAHWQPVSGDGTALDTPFIGVVASPAGDMTNGTAINWQSSQISFPQLVDLSGWSITGNPASGQTIQLSLLWNVQHSISASWSEFLHLTGPGTAVSLADGIPRGGQYPTWAWSTSEKIVETWEFRLPEGLASGEYAIEIGFYNPATNERLTVTQAGSIKADGSVPLLTFAVK